MVKIEGNIVDIRNRDIYHGMIEVIEENIARISRLGAEQKGLPFVMPGFVDAHVHIESSMLTPSNFARMAVVHGTVATVSDPHEIGNVLGVAGIEYMIEDGEQVPFHFAFGAPSCVPATSFETAGAVINAQDILALLARREIKYLAEMMNYPGVIFEDQVVMAKLEAAKSVGKPIDGHAPGLKGENAQKYFSHGISTDHECYTIEEAKGKLDLGVKILIREGSAAKNFNALIPLAHEYWQQMMFCSDDKHPDDLILGHINQLVVRAIKQEKIDVFKALEMACINPVDHYKLDVGLLKEEDKADFIMVKNLVDFDVIATYINGKLVAENGKSIFPATSSKIENFFEAPPITQDKLKHKKEKLIRVIDAHDGQLITSSEWLEPKIVDQLCVQDIERDLLKMAVYSRYNASQPAVAFIRGFGLKSGALASSVAHDSHNIICVGTTDETMVRAINAVISEKGGIVAVDSENVVCLPLPIAGLMSEMDAETVGILYGQIDDFSKKGLGSKLTAPFMTLSFMALLVIPELKLSDKGLFDGQAFKFVTYE